MSRDRFQREAYARQSSRRHEADFAAVVVSQDPCDRRGGSFLLRFVEGVSPDVLVVPEERRHLVWGRRVGTGAATGGETSGAQAYKHRFGSDGEAVPVVRGAHLPVVKAQVAAAPVRVGNELGRAGVAQHGRRPPGQVVQPTEAGGLVVKSKMGS